MALSHTDLLSEEDRLVKKHVVASLLSFAVALAPLVPIFVFSYGVFLFARDQAGLHPILSGGIALLTTGYSLFLLKISKLARYIYFGVQAVAIAGAAFLCALGQTELVLSSMIGTAALLVGLTLAFLASNFDEMTPER